MRAPVSQLSKSTTAATSSSRSVPRVVVAVHQAAGQPIPHGVQLCQRFLDALLDERQQLGAAGGPVLAGQLEMVAQQAPVVLPRLLTGAREVVGAAIVQQRQRLPSRGELRARTGEPHAVTEARRAARLGSVPAITSASARPKWPHTAGTCANNGMVTTSLQAARKLRVVVSANAVAPMQATGAPIRADIADITSSRVR